MKRLWTKLLLKLWPIKETAEIEWTDDPEPQPVLVFHNHDLAIPVFYAPLSNAEKEKIGTPFGGDKAIKLAVFKDNEELMVTSLYEGGWLMQPGVMGGMRAAHWWQDGKAHKPARYDRRA